MGGKRNRRSRMKGEMMEEGDVAEEEGDVWGREG